MKSKIFKQCQALFPAWQALEINDFEFDEPKGFSSFTMAIRARRQVTPDAVFYRRLEGKENAILEFAAEKSVYLTLAEHGIAARCHHYGDGYRIEAYYRGRSLQAADLFDADNLRKIAAELFRLHQLQPPGLPQQGFFELLHQKWGRIARRVLEREAGAFPPEERDLCDALRAIYSGATAARVQSCLPDGPLCFCHNDTYHGNIMRLGDGTVKLLDFEFSCRNHRAYDFANLFAETVMRHGLPEYPYFRIAEPEYGERELGLLIGCYLDHAGFDSAEQRGIEFERLLADTRRLLILSDYKYAMAALPLALAPIQKIRFIPYAWQRFHKFMAASEPLLT